MGWDDGDVELDFLFFIFYFFFGLGSLYILLGGGRGWVLHT